MEICKEAAVKGIGTPDREELALINALARRELGEDEVYTFALRLCDNDIDRDGERFDDGTLDALAPMFVGVSGVFDHQWSARGQTARIYRAGVVEGEGVLTADGRAYRYLKGWAYLMRTAENAALIAEIDGGIKREVSVGCAVDRVICSVCGQELDGCPHEKGEEYGGQVCCGVLTGAKDVYEWSFVAVPAQRRAGVIKGMEPGLKELSRGSGKAREELEGLEREAELGRRYLASLRAEVVRRAAADQPELDVQVIRSMAGKLEEGELAALKEFFSRKDRESWDGGAQLSYPGTGGAERSGDGAFLV